MATATNDIDEIRRRMAQIRHQLHEDVREVVAGTEAVTDWRRYVRMYPWAAVGVVSAAGYLLVPRRRRSVPSDVARQSDVAEMREELDRARAPEKEEKRRASLVGAAFGMLAPMAWRVVQNYAMGYLEQWIAQQQQHYMAEAGPSHGGHPAQPQSQSQPPPSGRPSGPRHS